MEKFRNTYRIPSARWRNWDYGWDAAYFITICTQHKQHYFGSIANENMKLSPIGVLADVFWHEIPSHANHVELGAFVVMPNHIHGILILNGNTANTSDANAVEPRHALALQSPSQKRFQNQGKNTISSIVGSYKSAVTKHAHRLGFDFTWQARFYDHIIRDARAYENISRYINNNPQQWHKDKSHGSPRLPR